MLQYNSEQLKQARANAGHTILQASVAMDCSHPVVCKFEAGHEPSQSRVIKNINRYCKKHLTKGVSK